MVEESLFKRARRYRYISCLAYLLYGGLHWSSLSPFSSGINHAIEYAVFCVAYLLLIWSLLLLMAAKQRPRWWGYLGLLGPIGLLLYFIPRYKPTQNF